jgi:hypothetical protein
MIEVVGDNDPRLEATREKLEDLLESGLVDDDVKARMLAWLASQGWDDIDLDYRHLH